MRGLDTKTPSERLWFSHDETHTKLDKKFLADEKGERKRQGRETGERERQGRERMIERETGERENESDSKPS